MDEREKLLKWMADNKITKRHMADRMSFSYDGIYQAIEVRRYFSPEFKWRFQEAFGKEAATSIFSEQPISMESQAA